MLTCVVSIMCLWMFHFASCHEDAKNRELQRTYCIPVSCRTTSLGSVGQSRQLAATSPCSPQELSVGSSNKGDRSKISFDLRKRPCLSFSHSVLLCPCISFHFISWFLLPCHSWIVNLFAFTDSQVVSVLNKVMLEDRIAALKPPKPPLKPLVKESRDAELVCTNLPDMPGPWLDMESPWDDEVFAAKSFCPKGHHRTVRWDIASWSRCEIWNMQYDMYAHVCTCIDIKPKQFDVWYVMICVIFVYSSVALISKGALEVHRSIASCEKEGPTKSENSTCFRQWLPRWREWFWCEVRSKTLDVIWSHIWNHCRQAEASWLIDESIYTIYIVCFEHSLGEWNEFKIQFPSFPC